MANQLSEERRSFSKRGVGIGITGWPHTKINSQCIKDLNISKNS